MNLINKLSFASLQNQSFNLSFKDYQFEKQDIPKDDQQSFFSDSSNSTDWIRVVEDKNLTFENQQNIISKINTLPIKVKIHRFITNLFRMNEIPL